MNSRRRPRSFLRRLMGLFLWTLMLAAIAGGALVFYAFRDRNPGYRLSVNIDGRHSLNDPRPLLAGFARIKITPDLTDPSRPVWLAGFHQKRAATGVHDDLWAMAAVLDDGYTRVGIVALDAIGFFHDDVIAVRQRLGRHLGLDYTIICSTHNHSTPDLMGLWGPNRYTTGVDSAYREQVISASARVLADAVEALQPAEVAFHEIPVKPENLVTDTRQPEVYDPNIRVMHFTHLVDRSTLGTIIGWANHPETPWARNTEITADFPGYLRDALERGLVPEGPRPPGRMGGIHVYINGAIGGLMTTSPTVTVTDPVLNLEFAAPSHEKARALGRQLAVRIVSHLQRAETLRHDHVPIVIRARTIEVPITNPIFFAAPVLGLIDRGHPGIKKWDKLRTEVALVKLGEASIACIPGEIYPELVNGGIERAPGGDFDIEPLELPPIRDLMPGRVKFVFGLANDEIGYIIPKSQWDRKPPYLYGSSRPVYGEIVSVGPDAAATIHASFIELCRPGIEQARK